MRIRRHVTAVGLGLGLLLVSGACGGSGGGDRGHTSSPPTQPAPPAANVDPNSDNVITGPINRTKQVANDADARDQQLDK